MSSGRAARAPWKIAAFAACSLLASTGCSVGGPGLEPSPGTPPATDDGLYYLPFPAGFSTVVAQGNFGVAGQGSHAHKYAIDFVMPLETPVVAARAGIVEFVRADCPNVNCPFDEDSCCGNYIRIRHSDGTSAAYWHLVQYGNCVNAGDHVARGDIIGKSGNTGISIGPHLHFMVYAPPGEIGVGGLGPSKDNSMEVSFEDVPGDGVPVFLMHVQSRNSVHTDHCDAVQNAKLQVQR